MSELYTIKQIAEIVGKTPDAVSKIFKRRNIKAVATEQGIARGGQIGLYTLEHLEIVKAVRRGIAFYKLSVFNENLGRFCVRACCLEKGEAARIKKSLEVLGLEVRTSLHIEKSYKYKYKYKRG